VRYIQYRTPPGALMAVDKPGRYLRKGLSIQPPKRVPTVISDTEAATRVQQAKDRLFAQLLKSA
jgi:hypothetical protein